MVLFECPRVKYHLVSFIFGVHCRVPFSLHAGKWKCCMWLVNKVEIFFAKIDFINSKWSSLNAPGQGAPRVINHLVSFSFGVHCRVPFSLLAGKGKWCMCLVNKVEIYLNHLVSFTFGVHCSVPFSLHAGKRKCCMWLVNKVEIIFAKMYFMDSKLSSFNAPG